MKSDLPSTTAAHPTVKTGSKLSSKKLGIIYSNLIFESNLCTSYIFTQEQSR